MPPTTRELAAGPCTGAVPARHLPPTARELAAGPCTGATRLVVAHTAQLDPALLRAAREMVGAAFGTDRGDGRPGSFDDDQDWDHALGGVHVLLFDGADVVGHAAVVQRRFLHADRTWRVGYVEAVAVAAPARRRGHGSAVMAAVEEVIARAYDFGALSATDDGVPLYRSRGWRPWAGPLAALTPSGVVGTPEEAGAVHVLPCAAPLDPAGRLVCDWRDGDLW